MPNFDHFDRLFVCFAAGLGLLLAGGLNLVLGRGGRRVWLRAAATLAACGAVVAGLSAFTKPNLALQAAGWLAGVLVVATVFGSEWVGRKLASVAGFFRKPAPRWGLVALTGLAVIIGSGVAFERSDEHALNQVMKDMEAVLGRPPSRPAEGIRATTDRGTLVAVKEPISPRELDELRELEEKTLRDQSYIGQVIRKAGPTDFSNCHGFVFTGGKYLIPGEEVDLILRENNYREVRAPRPGDLVVYRDPTGAVAHTAIVEYVTKGKPVVVEGKWGVMGVFQHAVDKSCYGDQYTYHRSPRAAHLLVGLGGTGSPSPEPASE
jgi:hypothetical protein